MIDRALYSQVAAIFEAQKLEGISVADVLAVIEQESNGVAIFRGTEPLFQSNVRAAVGALRARGDRRTTEQDIKNMITIPSGPMKGMYSKFRYESGYMQDFALPLLSLYPFSGAQLILLSSSAGLGQQMLRFVIQKQVPALMLTDAYSFMGNVGRQIEWVIGNLKQLKNPDKQLMFARYNGGPGIHPDGKVYNGYGASVVARAQKIDAYLKENHYV
jgi:hypothetical protein